MSKLELSHLFNAARKSPTLYKRVFGLVPLIIRVEGKGRNWDLIMSAEFQTNLPKEWSKRWSSKISIRMTKDSQQRNDFGGFQMALDATEDDIMNQMWDDLPTIGKALDEGRKSVGDYIGYKKNLPLPLLLGGFLMGPEYD